MSSVSLISNLTQIKCSVAVLSSGLVQYLHQAGCGSEQQALWNCRQRDICGGHRGLLCQTVEDPCKYLLFTSPCCSLSLTLLVSRAKKHA